MSNFTKKAIQESALKLLNQRPLSQITVKDIVTDCGINRNTFYYYYAGIPALIEDIFVEDADRVLESVPAVEKFEDCLEVLIDTALSKKQAALNIYRSSNRSVYEQCLWKACDHVNSLYVRFVLNGRRISGADLALVTDALSSLSFGLISTWLRGGASEDIKEKFARLAEIMRGVVEEMLSRCQEE